ncbi:MAG: ABC transporter substrate-binding protein [Telluria sp.]|nr:ABC transporter substrate-binding protein [Telluria sp.]
MGALCLAAAMPATAQVKVGFVAPMSGPQAIVGQDQYDGFALGLELLNNKLGGQPASVLKEDDQVKPEIGSEIVRKLIERDKVDAIVGLSFTNVLMASKRWIAQSGTVAIATNAGPSALAGEDCTPNMFVTAWQSDGPSEAMGKFVKDKGHKKVYLLAPNYQAGKDMLAGFKRFYGGQPIDEVYTQINQTDYSAEIAQIQGANPDAVFVFYPGGMGINFIKQMSQAGLLGKIPMYSVFTVDATTMPALRDAANGATVASMWDAGLDNPESKKFVAAFEAKYKRVPSHYAAAAFDAANLLDAAVRKAGPAYKDKKVFAAAVKAAGTSFKSVRGPFSFNNNNMPIQNYYVFKVGRDAGKLDTKLIATPLSSHVDAYASRCRASKS